MNSSRDVKELRVCAKSLREHREAIAASLFGDSGRDVENRFDDSADQLRQRVRDSLDFLIKHCEGRTDFGAIYAGQRNFELTDLQNTREENLQARRRSVRRDGEIYQAHLARHVSKDDLAAFEREYQRLTRGLVLEAQKHLRTLFIGDCIMNEILSFVVGPLADAGLSIEPFPINPREVGQFQRILSDLATKEFDIIFFSPFSHGRMTEVKALLASDRAFSPRADIFELSKSIIDQTRILLDEICRRFECPIFIHNAGLVPRARSRAKAAGRLALTYRARKLAGQEINRWLAEYVSRGNSATFQRLFVLDETALVRKSGRCALGQYLSTSEFLHSTVLSRRLAREYCVRMVAAGRLADKKLIICALDNTLWRGTIADGPVMHHIDRQMSLRRLKQDCGVVLSIASKNEPAYVHFRGGVLAYEDFVAPQINGNQKIHDVEAIKSALNLQTKHMVFLGDRPEERALVGEAYPDLVALDPNDPETWELIELWTQMTFGKSEIDRTKLYQAQALRDASAEELAADNAHGAILEKLGLVISVSVAKRSELKRVVELVNRTNQWNMCGSRITLEQAREWHESGSVSIFVANVADRFGDMGLVCVAVAIEQPDAVEIPLFVLSCRAFGYGVESAVLTEMAARFAVRRRGRPITGHYRSTGQNHPCRNMYSDHGFELKDGVFHWQGSAPIPAAPWAAIRILA